MKDRKVAKQSYVKSTYYGFSEFTQRAHVFESPLEVDYFNFLNFERHASRFEAQPFSVRYKICGQTRRYTPDFIVEIDDVVYIDEIKSFKETQSEKFKHKSLVLKDFFAARNQVFRVLTEHDIRIGERAKNLRFLQPALRRAAPTHPFNSFIGTLPYRTATVRDLQRSLVNADLDPVLCRQAVAHKLVNCDLTSPWVDIELSW